MEDFSVVGRASIPAGAVEERARKSEPRGRLARKGIGGAKYMKDTRKKAMSKENIDAGLARKRARQAAVKLGMKPEEAWKLSKEQIDEAMRSITDDVLEAF